MTGRAKAFSAFWPCIGVDEAGRGCLAGPVAAAAVLLPETLPPGALAGLTDSKMLSEAKRNALAVEIRALSLAWGVGLAWPEEIDRVNILNATFRAMSRAVMSLARKHPQALPMLLIDGPYPIRAEAWAAAFKGAVPPLPEQKPVVDGDALVPCISAASILAKTWRDSLLAALGRRYPGYGLEKHKGYGTREHLEMLGKLGPCPQHRLSFKPLRRDVEQLKLI